MKTQTINTFTFNELSEKVQIKVLDKFRYDFNNDYLELLSGFYNILEKDKDIFYSDENIKQIIIENDYEFLEDGTIF